MKLPLVHAAIALAVLCPLVSGQEIKLLASDGSTGDLFGLKVATNGTTVIVGADRDDDNGYESGSAYLFDATTGAQIAKLIASDGEPYDYFGHPVDIGETTAIAGASGDDDNGISSGSAYLFDINTGAQTAKLSPTDGASEDRFGLSVAISDNLAIVGAPYANGTGAAYLFETTNGTQLAKLLASDGATGDAFGFSIAISGDTAIVGARFGDGNRGNSGSAYLFDTSTGAQIAKLTASDGATNDYFGYSVAISGNTAIVGAWGDDTSGSASGSAYLFDTTTGAQIARLTASDATIYDFFGYSVAISGNTAIVGAQEGDSTFLGPGSAYLFDTTGTEIAKLTASDGADEDSFGQSVAISEKTLIIGAHGDDDNGDSSGSAYLYVWDCDGNSVADSVDIANGTSTDCDSNGEPDICEISSNRQLDLNNNGTLDTCECLANSYCIASPNSVSATGALISLDGIPSLSMNNLAIRAEDLRPNQFGVFFYGPVKQDPPVSFGDGYRCVSIFGLTRLNPPVPTGTGTAQRPLDMTSSPLNSSQAGDTRYFQFWYRDPAAIGAGYNLTDGLEITFCP